MLWPDPTQPIWVSPVNVDMKINHCAAAKSFLGNYLQLLACRRSQHKVGEKCMLGVPLMLVFLSPVLATDSQPYPEFTAVYDARINGFLMAEASFSLHKLNNGDYVYQRKSTSVGIASLFGKKVSTATSRWRFTNNRIQVLEFQSSDKDGDADDNLHLIFNWKTALVKNVSAVDPWQTKMPEGTLDKLAMQLALLLELRDGSTEFQYQVAHQGRIKQYRFKQTGKEKIDLPMGEFSTVIVERLDEDRDKTSFWSVPELNYFPVRFLKHKKSGVERELLLREVKFIGKEATD
jgi:hypothetical protein